MAEENGNKPGGGAQDLLQSLMSKEVVIPAVATAASVVAYAARKGAGEAKDKLEGEAEKLGEEGAQGAKKGLGGGGALGKLASKAIGGGGGGGDSGGGGSAKKTRRLPIQRWTDVAAPVGTVYEKWTQFEEYPNFMHRVLNVEHEDENKVAWDEKIWFSSRHWEGEITERKRNKRIAWKTTSGMAHAGVVTFHKLDDELTRVMVDMDFVPQGMIEKMASGMRFVKRAVQSDLARFKAYVEMGEAEGLEYQSKPAEREGEGQKEDKDQKGDEPRGESNGSSDESRERESAGASSE
jgi:Polyketide cyclase / dehydrase and lipid transport